MTRMQVSTHVSAPPARAFQVYSDLEHAAERVSGIEKLEVLTEGPIGKGTRFRETRKMFGKEATEVMEITDWRPGESYRTGAASHGCEYETEIRFVPDGDGTRVEMDFFARPVSLGAKILSPVFGTLMKGSMRKLLQKDIDDLKKVAEEKAPA